MTSEVSARHRKSVAGHNSSLPGIQRSVYKAVFLPHPFDSIKTSSIQDGAVQMQSRSSLHIESPENTCTGVNLLIS